MHHRVFALERAALFARPRAVTTRIVSLIFALITLGACAPDDLAPTAPDEGEEAHLAQSQAPLLGPADITTFRPTNSFGFALNGNAPGITASLGGWCDAGDLLLTGNFDGDLSLREDLLCFNPGVDRIWVATSTGTAGGFNTNAFSVLDGFCPTGTLGVADFNGDHKADIWCRDPSFNNNAGRTRVALSNGGAFVTWNSVAFDNWCASIDELYVSDFNADGKDDLLCRNPQNGNVWMAASSVNLNGGITFFQSSTVFGFCPAAGGNRFGIGRFNNDPLEDIFCHQANGNTTVALAAFFGFAAPVSFGNFCSTPNGTVTLGTGDFDGNGLTDLWCKDNTNRVLSVALSSVAGLGQAATWWGSQQAAGAAAWFPQVLGQPDSCVFRGNPGNSNRYEDFNGDGRSDLSCLVTTTSALQPQGSVDVLLAGPPSSHRFFDGSDWARGFCPPNGAPGTSPQLDALDFNGDGHSDISCHQFLGAGSTTTVMTSNQTWFGRGNGPVITQPKLYYIFYGIWNFDRIALAERFAADLSGSPWYGIMTKYKDANNLQVAPTFAAPAVYWDVGESQGQSLPADPSYWAVVNNAIAHGLPQDPSGIYIILASNDVSLDVVNDCRAGNSCGFHRPGYFSDWSTMHYAVMQYPLVVNGFGAGNCNGCVPRNGSASPNGDPGMDALLSVIAHEFVESISDPDLANGYLAGGNENADLCAWTFGPTQTLAAPGDPTRNGSSFNMTVNGSNYLVQENLEPVDNFTTFCTMALQP